MELKASITQAQAIKRSLDKAREQENRHLFTAMRVTGFRLRKVLQNEIRQGAPGGQPFAPRREITFGRRTRPPLQRLAIAVRYWARRNPDEVHIGFSGARLSKSWKRIAKMQQEGFTRDIDPDRRRQLARKGGKMGKRSKYRRFYFLKKSTKRFKTPARPIIAPFWAKHQNTAWRMVRTFYRRKVEGRRI